MPTALVTGCNRGIGLELAKQLTARGVDLIAAVRHRSEALEALSPRIETLDISDDDSVAALADRLGDVELDLLIHNAGVLRSGGLDDLDLDDVRLQLEVNSVGPLKLSAALADRMKPGSTLAIVTSRMGSIADNTSGGAYGYRMSKAAVNAVGRSLAHDLADREVAVVLLHPGYVRTDMTGGRGFVDPDASAEGLLARIDETTLDNTGRFVHMNGEALPW